MSILPTICLSPPPDAAPQQSNSRNRPATLEALIAECQATRTTQPQRVTLQAEASVSAMMVKYFGVGCSINIQRCDAIGFRENLLKQGLSENTVRKYCQYARRWFGFAQKFGYIEANPFESGRSYVTPSLKLTYLSEFDALKIMARIASPELRLAFAFGRWGALRIPSELKLLRWDHIDSASRTIKIPHSTAHRDDAGRSRTIPLFDELQKPLEEVRQRMAPGSRFVIERMQTVNWQTTRMPLKAAIRDAGINPWRRLWQNLRDSRRADLEKMHPATDVARWVGASRRVSHRMARFAEPIEFVVTPTPAPTAPMAGPVPPRRVGRPVERRSELGQAIQFSPAAPPHSVNELCDRFQEWAAGTFRDPRTGKPTATLNNIRDALKGLRHVAGKKPLNDVRADDLLLQQEFLVRSGLCRRTINDRIFTTKRLFRWARRAPRRWVAPDVLMDILEIESLRAGRTEAHDRPPVAPVLWSDVESVIAHAKPELAALIALHWWTGARPGELLQMRLMDIDRAIDPWRYTPPHHKNEFRGHARVICIGHRGQAILNRWINRPPWKSAAAFPVRLADAVRPVDDPTLPVFPSYPSTGAYCLAVRRICAARKIKHWSPNQIRHACATRLRSEIGLEAARVVLGHTSAATTLIYAEADHESASAAMRKHG